MKRKTMVFLMCTRTICGIELTDRETEAIWCHMINRRLSEDTIAATKVLTKVQ
jgi:hypothetical protein